MMLLALSSALAVEAEVAAEVGTLHNGDPAYDAFVRGNGMPSAGLRLGFRPRAEKHFPVGVLASWQHSSRGSDVSSVGPSYTAAFTSDTFALGPKVDVDLGGVLAPYVTAQGVLMRGLARFDDDRSDNDSPGQTRYTGVAPGVFTMGGIEASSPDIPEMPLEFLVFVEVGYGWVAPLELGGLGSMQPGGVVVRAGTGVRFGRSGR
ncbi:MAG: hypothetical protein R3F61_24080 [Myxococcota bacterium]